MQPLTTSELLKAKEALESLSDYKFEKRSSKVNSFIEYVMGKLGWYRKQTVYIVDKSKLHIFGMEPSLKTVWLDEVNLKIE